MGTATFELLQIARINKSYGTDGDLIVTISPDLPEETDLLEEPVFIIFDGLPVPFFVLDYSPRGKNKLVISLYDVDDVKYAEELIGKDLYIRKQKERTNSYQSDSDILGFTLIDQKSGVIGTIEDILDYSGNICLFVATAEGKILVPYHQDLVVTLDPSKKSILMRLPDGLID